MKQLDMDGFKSVAALSNFDLRAKPADTTMRALTLWRPWPWAIFHAPKYAKRIENRPWKPWPSIIGKRIVLHAGETFDRASVDDILELTETKVLPASATDRGLIGVATIRGYVESAAEAFQQVGPEQSDWFSGPFAWVLDDVRVFAEPIKIMGAQGLWVLPRWAALKVAEALR